MRRGSACAVGSLGDREDLVGSLKAQLGGEQAQVGLVLTNPSTGAAAGSSPSKKPLTER